LLATRQITAKNTPFVRFGDEITATRPAATQALIPR
jgi:hypothetical protein